MLPAAVGGQEQLVGHVQVAEGAPVLWDQGQPARLRAATPLPSTPARAYVRDQQLLVERDNLP
jgi:hypothetical protein